MSCCLFARLSIYLNIPVTEYRILKIENVENKNNLLIFRTYIVVIYLKNAMFLTYARDPLEIMNEQYGQKKRLF